MTVETEIFKTPLYDVHVKLGAKMVPFAGWEMPVQYQGVLQEYAVNRQRASIFDCSHMGEFLIEGEAVAVGLDQLITQPIVDMAINTCRYGAMLNDQGGVIDDLIVYRLAQDRWMIVCNAANIEKNKAHMLEHLTDSSAFRDVSFQTAKLDIQGPLSRQVLSSLVEGIEGLSYYESKECVILAEKCIVSRTGYTGELGYEIYFPWGRAKDLWNEILKNDMVKPTGLAVRDVLRLEMCYCLYGHELSEEISPLEAGLKRFIDVEKDFIGKEALERLMSDGVSRALIAIRSASRRAPREGQLVFDSSSLPVGVVTSGSFSPSLEVGIGLALVERGLFSVDDECQFGTPDKLLPAIVSKRPFYREGSLKA